MLEKNYNSYMSDSSKYNVVPNQDQLSQLKEARLRQILDPSHSALLIIDMQNDFLSPQGKSAAVFHQSVASMIVIIPKIAEMVKLFRSKGRPIIRTINYEDPDLRTEAMLDRFYFTTEAGNKNLTACLKGTPGAELYLKAEAGDILIEKDRFSAYGPKLNGTLTEFGIRTLFITGVKTQRCVKRTVDDLYEREQNLHVVVLEDCVASDDQIQHEAALKELKSWYPPVINSETLAYYWSRW
jgi:ureidoacrylate peracid hydrolase